MIKLNIGCGPNGQIEGFINVDNSKAILLSKYPLIKKTLYKIGIISEEKYKHNWDNVKRLDVSKGLPYQDDSVDKIFSSHFLEHIPYEKAYRFLQESRRVLKKNGVMRLIVPDLLFHSERYVSETRAVLNGSSDEYTRTVHDNYLNTVYGAYLGKSRFGLEHCYMYDIPTLYCMLKEIGFGTVIKQEYKVSLDKELSEQDNRPEESIYFDIQK